MDFGLGGGGGRVWFCGSDTYFKNHFATKKYECFAMGCCIFLYLILKAGIVQTFPYRKGSKEGGRVFVIFAQER
jgi:hypothetical protein